MPTIPGKPVMPREYIYMYYKPEWGNFKNGVFARNQKYKLYGDGRFYDVEKDVLEKSAMDLTRLRGGALRERKKLQGVLDRMPALND